MGDAPRADSELVALSNVGFAYPGGKAVIGGLTLSIPRGSITGIVGPSGCGKSTVLALISGLLQHSSGNIVRSHAGGRHALSMMFQKDTLLPWMTARENVLLYSRFRRHRRAAILRGAERRAAEQKHADELLRLVHLGGQGDVYPYQLSGGMRRRVAFLSSIAPNPELLLLDEPFSAIDEPTRIGIHQDVFRIIRLMGTTTVLVTHDLAEAITLCDRVLILTKRPTIVYRTHEIPFGAERDMMKLREQKDFLSLYAALWHDLSEQIAASSSEAAL